MVNIWAIRMSATINFFHCKIYSQQNSLKEYLDPFYQHPCSVKLHSTTYQVKLPKIRHKIPLNANQSISPIQVRSTNPK